MADTTDSASNLTPGSGFIESLRGSRDLLLNLTSRELKIRYKRSALGFVWSLLNPLLMMAVFTVIFDIAFKAPIHDFPLYFLSGYLPFAFFQASSQIATGVVVGNAGLIQKVWFPRSVLPLSVVLSQLVHFLLAMVVLLTALAIDGYNFLPYLPGLILGVLLLAVFTAGVAMFFAATNTIFRDIQEFTGVLFLLWFYLTPVVYAASQLPPKYRWVIHLNPLYYFVTFIRSTVYDLQYPTLGVFVGALLSAVGAFVGGAYLFGRLSSRFAKEV
jgi:ABC-2 type transport system permease protein